MLTIDTKWKAPRKVQETWCANQTELQLCGYQAEVGKHESHPKGNKPSHAPNPAAGFDEAVNESALLCHCDSKAINQKQACETSCPED